jgi:hypothetical protein
MSAKFASITADLLARKGGAVPSVIAGKPLIDWNAPVQPFTPMHDTAADPRHEIHVLHRDEAHYMRKIQIGLSDHDHERLRILSARKETSRQQVVRDALCAYFEKQAHEYREECRCLAAAGPCQKACGSR